MVNWVDKSIRTINLIAAVGVGGKMGLDGKVPWLNPCTKDKELCRMVKEDMKIFSKLTANSHMIAGTKTYLELDDLIKQGKMQLGNRKLYQFTSHYADNIPRFLKQIPNDRSQVWVIGGAQTYKAFAPHINGFIIINNIPYDGPADTYFPFEV